MKKRTSKTSAPVSINQRVISNFRVPPFRADDVLVVEELRNIGSKRKPDWRVKVRTERAPVQVGWLDADTLVPVADGVA